MTYLIFFSLKYGIDRRGFRFQESPLQENSLRVEGTLGVLIASVRAQFVSFPQTYRFGFHQSAFREINDQRSAQRRSERHCCCCCCCCYYYYYYYYDWRMTCRKQHQQVAADEILQSADNAFARTLPFSALLGVVLHSWKH